ncbi:MAG: hypothetical protein IJ407_03965 [Clostridia bacterium]|nr:hypothetical protein [Clostridia bacterium]
MKERKVSISLSFDPDILQQAKEHAAKEERTLSRYVNWVLRQHFRKKE